MHGEREGVQTERGRASRATRALTTRARHAHSACTRHMYMYMHMCMHMYMYMYMYICMYTNLVWAMLSN